MVYNDNDNTNNNIIMIMENIILLMMIILMITVIMNLYNIRQDINTIIKVLLSAVGPTYP